jgi:hypothetical protein
MTLQRPSAWPLALALWLAGLPPAAPGADDPRERWPLVSPAAQDSAPAGAEAAGAPDGPR